MKIEGVPCAFLTAFFSIGVMSAQTVPTSPVTVTVTTNSHGYAIPIDFSGLSFERGTLSSGNAGASGYIFSPSNSQVVPLFQNLGIKNLRVGGGSVDDESVVGTGSDGYLGVDNLFGFSKASGANVIYTVRLLNPSSKPIPNLMAEDAAAAGYVWSNYKANLVNFAIGNEPDFFSYHTVDPLIFQTLPERANAGTAFPSYLADWTNFADAIEAAAPASTAVGEGQDLYVTVINKTHSSTNDVTTAALTIQPSGFTAASAAWMALSNGNPGNAATTTGTTLGGAAIANNAPWFGEWTPLNPSTGGGVTLTVPSASAAVIHIRAASNYGGPVQINQNGALDVFALDPSGNVWHDRRSRSLCPRATAMFGITGNPLPAAYGTAGSTWAPAAPGSPRCERPTMPTAA